MQKNLALNVIKWFQNSKIVRLQGHKVKLSNLIYSKSLAGQYRIFDFFKIFMILFDQIELTTYPKKPFDSMDFNAKEALSSSSFRSNRIIPKILIKFQKNLKIRNLFDRYLSTFSFQFDFDLIRIKFECFTVCLFPLKFFSF